jgi:hypothetical protein
MATTEEHKTEEEIKYFTPEEALEKAKRAGMNITYATLLKWVDTNKLGFQPGGAGSKWFVDKEKFNKFLEGNFKKGGVVSDGKK